jgi:putative transposase
MCERTRQLIKMVIKLTVPKDKRNRGAKNKEDLDHYIEVIEYILRTGIQWKELNAKLHYTTYHKKFMKWASLNVFQNAFYILTKLMKSNKYIDTGDLQNLYIDSSMVKNIRGVNDTGINHYDRGKQANKVTVTVTDKGIPLGIHVDTANKHDVTLVLNALDDIKIKIVGSRLIADKGYISKKLKTTLHKERKIYLVCPRKSTQNIILPKIHRDLLAKRNIVENFFSWIMNFRRIRVRYERKLQNYIQFYYLAMIEVIYKKCNDI